MINFSTSNKYPEVVGELEDITLSMGETFSVTIPEGFFIDKDNDELTIEVEAKYSDIQG